MIDIDELIIEMLKTLFPDVASPGFSTGAVFAGLFALVALTLFFIAVSRRWHESWVAFYLLVAGFSGVACLILYTEHRDMWHDVTLPGAISRDPEAVVVVQRVRKDIEWINERAANRQKKLNGK